MIDNIKSIILGIRFSKSFRITDLGEIFDDILYDSNSPFGTKMFPKIQKAGFDTTLYNGETEESLTVNVENFVIKLQVDNNFNEKYEWLQNKAMHFLKNDIFKNYRIKNIKKIGLVFQHEMEVTNRLQEYIGSFTSDHIDNVNNIRLSFSQKLKIDASVMDKTLNNYKNVIYTFEQKEGFYNVNLDFQYVYDPIVEDLWYCKTDEQFKDAAEFLINKFYIWVT